MSHFEYNGPINRNPGPNEVGIIVYGYWPSLALGVVGVVTFGIAMLINTWYAYRKKGIYRTFSILLAIGCLVELGGYATRIFSHFKPFNLSAYIASATMVILAPVIFAAAIDFSLNIVAIGFQGSEGILLLSPRNVLIVFITADVVAITVQGLGSALVGYTTSSFFNDKKTFISYEQANSIMIAGLALQIAAWMIFILFLVISIYRAYTRPLYASSWYDNMRTMLWVVFAGTIFLLWRACYRLAEVILGYLSGPATREDYLASFEYLPVILGIIIFTAFPPHWFVERRRIGEPPSGSSSSDVQPFTSSGLSSQEADLEKQAGQGGNIASGRFAPRVEPMRSNESGMTAVEGASGPAKGM